MPLAKEQWACGTASHTPLLFTVSSYAGRVAAAEMPILSTKAARILTCLAVYHLVTLYICT
ncbi:MAG: hypothetical protein IIC01_03790 [Planctomycetes bacterium]|nr:hypothetical protein [Planctomycetota bacterium]